MYLKDRPSRRRRKRSSLPILLIALALLIGVGYIANQEYDLLRNPFQTPTPAPTPTRSTLSILDEVSDLQDQGTPFVSAYLL